METLEAAEESSNENFRALLDFSLGRINDLEVRQLLGMESDEDLFLLMTLQMVLLALSSRDQFI